MCLDQLRYQLKKSEAKIENIVDAILKFGLSKDDTEWHLLITSQLQQKKIPHYWFIRIMFYNIDRSGLPALVLPQSAA